MKFLILCGAIVVFSIFWLLFSFNIFKIRLNLSRENPNKKMATKWFYIGLISSILLLGIAIFLFINPFGFII